MLSTLALLLVAPQSTGVQLAPIPPRPSGRHAVVAPGSSAAAAGGSASQAGSVPDFGPGTQFSPPNSFNVDSFGFTDPNPTGFHPLDDNAFTVLCSDESLLITAESGASGGVRREDAGEGRASAGSLNHHIGGYRLQSAATGDFFGDGRELTVTVSRRVDDTINLRIWAPNAQGSMVAVLDANTIYVSTTQRIEIDCADMDADGRAEIAVAATIGGTSRVMVFEDAVQGDWTSGAPLAAHVETDLGTSDFALLSCGEFDGDQGDEVAVLAVSSSTHDLRILDDMRGLLGTLASRTYSTINAGDVDGGRYVRAFDHDGDGIDAVAHFSRGSLRVAEVDLAGATFASLGSSKTINSDGPIALTPIDETGTGVETLAYLDTIFFSFGNNAGYDVYLADISSAGVWSDRRIRRFTGNDRAVDNHIVALDDDRDGSQELRIALGVINSSNLGPPSYIREIGVQPSGGPLSDFDVERSSGQELWPGIRKIAYTAGDDDGESVKLRYTNRKEILLSDPMPVVLMEAVPTKAGISQNYAASGSTFTQGMSSTVSYSTTTAVSTSLSAGVSTDSLFGAPLAASAKLTIGAEVSRTTGVDETVRTFTTYGSSHDVHSIVFQGTLHVVYVYEVVAADDPNAVGATFTINVPVATDEWKWPLDFYNQVFPTAPIRPEVAFAHSGGATVIGDPASYASEAELTGLVLGSNPAFDGWVGGDSSVGLGGSFNGFGLSLSTVNTTSDSLTLSVEASTEFGVSGVTLGASLGLSTSFAYTIATADDTEYAATIGDIADFVSDYPDWNYRAGLVVIQERNAFDAPLQVMRYWVDPLGAAYP